MTLDRERILAKLREQRDHIERENGLRMIGIVGSVARGEARKDSDACFRTSARPPSGHCG